MKSKKIFVITILMVIVLITLFHNVVYADFVMPDMFIDNNGKLIFRENVAAEKERLKRQEEVAKIERTRIQKIVIIAIIILVLVVVSIVLLKKYKHSHKEQPDVDGNQKAEELHSKETIDREE